MKKKVFYTILALVILAGVMLIIRGSEDRWICADGEWIKHGVPGAPKPDESC